MSREKKEKYIYKRPGDKWIAFGYIDKDTTVCLGTHPTYEEAVAAKAKFLEDYKEQISYVRCEYKKYKDVQKRSISEEEFAKEFPKKEEAAEVTPESAVVKTTKITFGSSQVKPETEVSPKDIKMDLGTGIYEGKAPANIMLISDIHFPYHHEDALAFIKEVYDVYSPEMVVILGDEIDSNALSFYPYHPSLANASLELKQSKALIKELDNIIEDSVVLAVESNHTSRVYRKGKSAGIPKEMILPYDQLLGVDWKYAKDWIIPLVNGTSLLFTHQKGMTTRLAGQAAGSNIAAGHFHKRGGVEWWTTNRNQEMFSISCPCLIDFNSAAYSYDENSINRPNLGVAVIENGMPYVHPMFVNKDNRWTGELWMQYNKESLDT